MNEQKRTVKVDGKLVEMGTAAYKAHLNRRKEVIARRIDELSDRMFDPEEHDVGVLQKLMSEYNALTVRLAKVDEELYQLSKSWDGGGMRIFYDMGSL